MELSIISQNSLKLETVTNKSCGACDKVHVHQISSYLVNLCGHNRTKCPKTTIFFTSKMGFRLKSTSKWPQIEKSHY